jgi:type IV pilus assembly protein PilN
MILINLLPHREAKKKRRREAFYAMVGFAAILGGVLLGLGYFTLQGMIDRQNQRNEFIRAKNKELDAQIKDIATLRAEIEALRARQTAVEDLQADRNMPIYLFSELVRQTPEGIFLREVRQAGQVVTVTGYAQSQERVSDYLRNAGSASQWLEKPELNVIKSANVQLGPRETKRLYEFSLKFSLKRPRDIGAQKAGEGGAPAASAPAAAAAPKA